MKKLISFLFIIAFVVSCDPKHNEVFKLDTDATILLKPASGVKLRSTFRSENHLSALEIVKQADVISFSWDNDILDRGFGDHQRDTLSNPPYLIMFPGDIIDQETGELNPHFIEASDVVISRLIQTGVDPISGNPVYVRDTIGYVSNETLRTAETAVKSAYVKGNVDEIYNLFSAAYTFQPITADEWKALKQSGQN